LIQKSKKLQPQTLSAENTSLAC